MVPPDRAAHELDTVEQVERKAGQGVPDKQHNDGAVVRGMLAVAAFMFLSSRPAPILGSIHIHSLVCSCLP